MSDKHCPCCDTKIPSDDCGADKCYGPETCPPSNFRCGPNREKACTAFHRAAKYLRERTHAIEKLAEELECRPFCSESDQVLYDLAYKLMKDCQ